MYLNNAKLLKSIIVVYLAISLCLSITHAKAFHTRINSGYIIWDGYLEVTGVKVYSIRETIQLSFQQNVIRASIHRELRDLKAEGTPVVYSDDIAVSKDISNFEGMYLVFINHTYPEGVTKGIFMFPISIYSIFDTSSSKKLARFVERNFTEVPGIVYESWDIVFGTLRYVIYAELYTANKKYIEEGILEMILTIDKNLGIILNFRASWYYKGAPHTLFLRISDTNLIPKHRLTITIIGSLVAIILIVIVIKKKVLRGER